jgi:lipopolysaccharide transport system permease protein
MAARPEVDVLIAPHRGWQALDVREMWRHRELLGFLVWRDLRLRYRQTLFGALWAVLQPVLATVVFTALFARVSGFAAGDPPYPLFAFAGLMTWMFFTNAILAASTSLVGNQDLVTKIYVPRIFIPLGAIGALLVDLVLNLLVAAGLLVYFRWSLSPAVALLPLFLLGTLMAAVGVGLIMAALNVYYRDVKYAVPFVVQLGLFVTPIIYPLREVPDTLRLVAAINPMSAMVEGVRHALLATPLQWSMVATSMAACAVLLVVGLFIFRRMERRLADVI